MNLLRLLCLPRSALTRALALNSALLPVATCLAQTPPSAVVKTDNEAIELSPFIVSTNKDKGYLVANSISATRINAAIVDTPVTINVVSRELIDDIGAFDLKKALEYTSGVSKDNAEVIAGDSAVNLRGIPGGTVFRNGFPAQGIIDTVNINRVEVVKGPSSVLYGNSSPGGLVNYVTRRPMANNFGSVRVTVGSYEYRRAEFDVNRRLDEGGNHLFRISASGVDSGSFRRFEDYASWLVAPSYIWNLASKTTLSAELEHFKINKTEPRILSVANDFSRVLTELPLNYNAGGRNSFSDREKTTFTTMLDHAVTDTISTRLSFNSWNGEAKTQNINAHAPVQPPDFQSINRRPRYIHSDDKVWHVRNDWLLEVKTGGIEQSIVLGLERSFRDSFTETYNGTARAREINIYQFNQLPDSAFDFPNFPDPEYILGTRARATTQVDAAYINNSITALEGRLHGLVGVRYDRLEVTDKLGLNQGRTKSQVSPQASVLFKATESLGLFASYSTSLAPNPLDAFGNLFDPQEGVGYDVGFKFSTKDQRISGTLSAFQVTKTNIPTLVFFTDPNTGFIVSNTQLVGEQQSKGWEMDWIFSPNDNWQIIANCAFLKSTITKGRAGATATSPSPDQGMDNFKAPREQGGVWTKYSFKDGSAKGLSVAGGLVYVGRMVGIKSGVDANGRDRVAYYPGYARTDISLDYATKFGSTPVAFSVKLINAFDKRYVENEGYYGQPRSIFGSAEFKF